MKSILLLLSLVCLGLFANAQNGISFQGIARDAQGLSLSSKSVTVKFTIGSFTETQTRTTDNYGVFSAVIGSVNTAGFNNLIFANITDKLKVDVDGVNIYNDNFNYAPYAKAAENGVPPGTIIPFAGPVSNIPAGYLYCDGSSYAGTGMYGKLAQVIGFAWGNDGGKFRVPDLRGMFIRGVDDTAGIDEDKTTRTAGYAGGNTGNAVGSKQLENFKAHNHTATSASAGAHTHTYYDMYHADNFDDGNTDGANGNGTGRKDNAETTSSDGAHTHTITVNNTGANETRPDNAYVIYIIKY